MRRSSGFWAAGTLSIASRSCSSKLASRFSVILLFRGESPPGINSALELSMLGLVRVMSSLLAIRGRERKTVFVCSSAQWCRDYQFRLFVSVFPKCHFRVVEEKVALEMLHVSAVSHLTTQWFSQWESQMFQQSHQFMWKIVLLEAINSP